MGIIEVNDVTHKYYDPQSNDELEALKNVSFEVNKNEFITVVGSSGCGKSTLLRILAGLIIPTQGQVKMNGKIIKGPSAERGMVFQEYALLPWRTVLQNVEMGLKFKGEKKEKRNEQAKKTLELVNLLGFEKKYPYQLSGGMKQRVALAMVLANEPEVMLMDEPFGALDAQTRYTLQNELMEISKKSKTTIVFITHSVDEAVFLGDRLFIMTKRPGRIKEEVNIPIKRENRTKSDVSTKNIFNKIKEEVMSSVRREVKQNE